VLTCSNDKFKHTACSPEIKELLTSTMAQTNDLSGPALPTQRADFDCNPTVAMVLSCADYSQWTTVYVTTKKHARLPFSLYTVRFATTLHLQL